MPIYYSFISIYNIYISGPPSNKKMDGHVSLEQDSCLILPLCTTISNSELSNLL